MNQETHNSSQERKSSSRTSLGYYRPSQRQSKQQFQGNRTSALKQINNKSCINLQKMKSKQPNRPCQRQSDLSGHKNHSKLRNQQSSDYIRNLYKKYLGKENSNNHSERKLKTEVKNSSKKFMIAENHQNIRGQYPRQRLFAVDNTNLDSKKVKTTSKMLIISEVQDNKTYKKHQTSVNIIEDDKPHNSTAKLSKRSHSHHSIKALGKSGVTSQNHKKVKKVNQNVKSEFKGQKVKKIDLEKQRNEPVDQNHHLRTSYSDYKQEVIKYTKKSLFEKDETEWTRKSNTKIETRTKLPTDNNAQKQNKVYGACLTESKMIDRKMYCQYDTAEENELRNNSKIWVKAQQQEVPLKIIDNKSRFFVSTSDIQGLGLIMGENNMILSALQKIKNAKALISAGKRKTRGSKSRLI